MGAGAALPGGRVPFGGRRRNHLVLALTVGLHLLAVLFWLRARPPRPALAQAPRVVTILLQLRAPGRPRAPAPMPVRVPRQPHPAAITPPASRVMDTPALPVPTAPAPLPGPASADPLAAPRPAAPDAATLACDPAAAAHGSFTLGLARREAGRIDRELRGGKSGVPLDADTPWARFQHGFEAAHVDRSLGVSEESYTAPDGVVIYRRRIGGRVLCYRTGGVGLGVAGAVGLNDAGAIQCPSRAEWKREN